MEASKPLMKHYTAKLKQATLLWLDGFREACCLHRVVILCYRSRELLIRTGQCFLLNGFIFLGSMFVLNRVVVPMLHWILPDQSSQFSSQIALSLGCVLKFYSIIRHGLIQLFYVFWFYPLYVFSLILSNIWYNDIAKFGFAAMGRSGPSGVEPSSPSESITAKSTIHTKRLAGLGGVVVGIAEQVYSVLLLSFFFLEVFATGFVPYVGKVLNFLLLSWMYAYYCFEYKWNISEVALEKRLDFFESNWAFFAGFGSPCVLAIFLFSPLVSYGVMAILFPLFVLTATGSGAEQDISFQRRKWKGVGLGRLPIFYAADTLSFLGNLVDDFSGAAKVPTSKKQKIYDLLSERDGRNQFHFDKSCQWACPLTAGVISVALGTSGPDSRQQGTLRSYGNGVLQADYQRNCA